MEVITPGHRYILNGCEDPRNTQEIQFIEKASIYGSDQLKTLNDGTTNEEVIQVLIDRLQHLNKQHPCRENAISITKLEEALMWQEKRTANRKQRDVEGKKVD